MNRFRSRPAQPAGQANSTQHSTGRRFGISASTKRSLVILLILAVVAVLAFFSAPFWMNWLWFDSVGYRSVLVTSYLAQGITFFVTALIAALLFYTNVRLAIRNTKKFDIGTDGRAGRFSNAALKWLGLIGTGVVAFTAGRYFSNRWEEVLLFLNGREFGVTDPTFNRDVGFYVFRVPFLRTLENTLMLLLLVTLAAVLIVYLVRMGVRFRSLGTVPMAALRHIMGLFSALLLVIALGYLLSNFELVHSSRGVVNGPGFTDTNIVRWINYIMVAMSLAAAVALLTGYVLRNARILIGILGIWLIANFVLTPLLPMAVQRFIVEPNEFQREQGYISHNVEMTRQGWGIDDVQRSDLTGQEQLVPSQLNTQPGGDLSNVRIWDYRVVGPVFQQVQSFVPFYEFVDIDVDRYTVDGNVVQVIVGPRELSLDGLESGRRTWTNEHLVYTHGYGYVMSPVSGVSNDGWPVQMVSGVPITGPESLLVEKPQLYFGESDLQWIILFTDQSEIAGLDDSGTSGQGFEGDVYGSVSLGNPFTRAMAAISLGDRNVFFTNQLTGDSRIVQSRNVVERADRIAPFLEYDNDPYLVIADGRMYWVVDAYTETDMYPHATSYDGKNYMRNSVKVVVDAYSGETTFYRTAVEDPIADAWGSIYSDLFTPISEAPAELTAHFRYPEELYTMQADVMGDYHMDDARTWYDGDDRWSRAKEASDDDNRLMEPYFVNQELPSDSEQDFWLTIPFTPGGNRTNENMTAWMAGRSDELGNTELRLYRYPRQVTVYGPRQIEAMIDQDPDISSQITLWSQGGSKVIRGNMLVIPVGDSLLYVQPLYLQATGTSASAPTLARVIVAANNQIVMRPTLQEAIEALDDPNADTVDEVIADPEDAANGTESESTPETDVDTSALPADLQGMSESELQAEALSTLERADKALSDGDPVTYQSEMNTLRLILVALNASPTSPVATPGT